MRSKRPTATSTSVCLGLALSFFALACSSAKTTAVAQARAGRVFYVASNGHDWNRGTSVRHPWRTVFRVDKAHLRPGDSVLFKGGEWFTDDTLMPGWGYLVSGAAGRPISFGSYGRGRATLAQGVWLGTDPNHPRGPHHLSFKSLALGPNQGFQGTGDYIKLEGLKITNILRPASQAEVGIMTRGSYWVIARNTIDRTGDSGMLLGFTATSSGDPAGGHGYLVYGNVITNTGIDPAITYGSHGIYVKVADATISHNWIANFRDDGVSARYHDATITHNLLANGSIGIAWFQYDDTPGTSHFTNNTIFGTTEAGIFVCGRAESCRQPIESFVIEHNSVRRKRGDHLNLQPTTGSYRVADNP